MNPTPPETILLTIDVEDWFQVENLRPWFPPSTWDSQEFRVEQNTHRILNLLDSMELPNPSNTSKLNKLNKPNKPNKPDIPTTPKATFFVLSWVAERFPGLVREIQNRGHEIASHGCNHLMCNKLSASELRQDLTHSKEQLENITGAEVKGYRAPNFSISDSVLRIIEECGYKYDSSFNNFARHGRYGTIAINGRKKVGMAYQLSRSFFELPIINLSLMGQTIPWGGGGYFRFFPLSLFKAGINQIIKKHGAYVFYLHPWEIDFHQPRVKQTKGLSAWKHYLNLDKTYTRLENFISTFKHCRFPTCCQYLDL